VSFGIKGGRDGQGFIEALLFRTLPISGCQVFGIHNATTTHSQLTADELAAAGVPEDMVLSVGIEHVEDLIADLDQAPAAAAK
jgi:O-acetylhomoserine (thiol)-lyase